MNEPTRAESPENELTQTPEDKAVEMNEEELKQVSGGSWPGGVGDMIIS
jgi:bacteriocin-like protein